MLETRDHFGNLNGDVNCEDFIEVISEDVFTADITTAASQYQVSAGVTTKPGVDYGVANSDGTTGDDGSGIVLQSASEIGTTQGKVSTGVTGDGNVNLNCSKVSFSAADQTDGDHSVLETRDHFGNLNGDVNCEDFIEVISEDVFTADITTAASQYQVSAGVTTKPGVDYGVANSDGTTGDDGSGIVLQSASEIGTTQGKVSTGVTGDGNVNLSCSKVSFSAAGNLLIPITINGVSLHAVLDTAAQVSVVWSRFVDNFLPSLQFFGAFTLNGIKLIRLYQLLGVMMFKSL